MILKIRREEDLQDWWILDDIRKVSVSKTFQKSYAEMRGFIEAGSHDILLIDKFFNIQRDNTRIPADTDRYCSIELICRRTDDTEFCILFDTVAFLCNDKGQTIEKIAP